MEITGDETPAVDGVHEPKRVLGLARLALRSCLDRQLTRTRDEFGAVVFPKRDAAGAPSLRPQRFEAQPCPAERGLIDLPSIDIEHTQPGIALGGRPRDPEDE